MSLACRRYYAHPRNGFWPIIGNLLGFDPHERYQQRLEKLNKNRIALWDVLSNCRRKGSLDTSIERESMLVNDFERFFGAHPSIRYVMFNGQRAEIEFKRHVMSIESIRSRNLELHRLPSTSPAMATLTLDQKIAAWSCIADILSLHDFRY
jgi:hypoxanthine-DNA glycosylase